MTSPSKLEPEKWVERYTGLLYNYASIRIRRNDIAKDMVQDTFLSALKAIDSFRGDSSEKTWLMAILKRKIIDHYRKSSTQRELAVLDNETKDDFMNQFSQIDSIPESSWSGQASPVERSKDFSTKVEKDEFHLILKKCLDNLPEKWSAVFCLKNIDDMDSDEICTELGISPSNFWVLMHRAKLQLRACMDVNWLRK